TAPALSGHAGKGDVRHAGLREAAHLRAVRESSESTDARVAALRDARYPRGLGIHRHAREAARARSSRDPRMMPWLFLLASYLVGATPTSYIVARRFHGIDLREHGSGNLGATNAFRVLGWKAATPIFIIDIFKGWLPAALFPLWDGVGGWGWPLAYGAMAVVGHVFSIYVGFRGGKGVATGAGVFLA